MKIGMQRHTRGRDTIRNGSADCVTNFGLLDEFSGGVHMMMYGSNVSDCTAQQPRPNGDCACLIEDHKCLLRIALCVAAAAAAALALWIVSFKQRTLIHSHHRIAQAQYGDISTNVIN